MLDKENDTSGSMTEEEVAALVKGLGTIEIEEGYHSFDEAMSDINKGGHPMTEEEYKILNEIIGD